MFTSGRCRLRDRVKLGAVVCGLAAGLGVDPTASAQGSTPDPVPFGIAERAPSPRLRSLLSGGGLRGVTIGPIENAYHPDKGYGSTDYVRTLRELRGAGATWIALTVFGRVGDLDGLGVDWTFERPFAENRRDLERAIDQAHEQGLRVFLVPHLWVESKKWRAEINPTTDRGWERWARSYGDFVTTWAKVAEAHGVDLFSVGVELRSWVTTTRAPSFVDVIRRVRGTYHGPITYSANWDDVAYTTILSELDVIGINAFYPLASNDGASQAELLAGAERIRADIHALSEAWKKPVLFTEIGYTTRPNPAIRPWLWPDDMADVVVDEGAQATAYRALLAPMLGEPNFIGFFVWRVYADPDDTSQEAEWGFSPRGKLAELVMRDAFATKWAVDGPALSRWGRRADVPGLYRRLLP
jgi:hypothetical protein